MEVTKGALQLLFVEMGFSKLVSFVMIIILEFLITKQQVAVLKTAKALYQDLFAKGLIPQFVI